MQGVTWSPLGPCPAYFGEPITLQHVEHRLEVLVATAVGAGWLLPDGRDRDGLGPETILGLDQVLDAGSLAVGTVAVIAKELNHRLRGGDDLARRDETYWLCQVRKRVRVAMRHPHAAASQQIVAAQSVAIRDDNEAKVVRENVNVVQRRNRERGFEFSRQIGFAVKRIDKFRRVFELQLGPFHPNLVVGWRGRQERLPRERQDLIDAAQVVTEVRLESTRGES